MGLHVGLPGLFAVMAAASLLAGCASDNIIIDRQGINAAQYEQDLSDCERYAAEVDHAGQIAKSAGVGAAVGGLLGAVLGDSESAARGAGAGALQGGAQGGLNSDREAHRVVVNCLKGRGYRVLN